MPSKLDMEVIPARSFAQRLDGLIQDSRPAIVTGLFDGQPFSGLTAIEGARRLAGSAALNLEWNAVDLKRDEIKEHEVLGYLWGEKRTPKVRPATLDECIDLATGGPDAPWIYAVGPAPEALVDSADMSALGISSLASGYPDQDAPRPHDKAYAVLFVGNQGNATDLHTDWDGNDALLYQGFGTKRVTVFPPAAAPLLHPIGTYSTVRLGGMPEWARQDLLRYAGGFEHLLRPGEAVFMPAFCWHHLEYLDLSLSASIRFNGILDPEFRYPIGRMHQDLYLQNLMVAARHPALSQGVAAAMGELRRAFERPYPSARDKYRALRALAKAKCLELGLIYGEYPQQTWLDFEDFLDGTECAAYNVLPNGSGLRRWWWHNRERGRSALRRAATRVAHWA